VPVPVHKGQTLPKGTLKSVIKLSGIPESDFFDAL
jgi:predicted RNA binding protein YcfA (HicA-like mRNA interferase family)